MRCLIGYRTSFRWFGLFVLLAVLSAPLLAQMARPRPAAKPPLTRGSSYFPLGVGFKWVYTLNGATGPATRQVEVVAAEMTATGRMVYQLKGYFGDEPAWVTVGPSGRVVQIEEGQDYLWYELGGDVGRRWQMKMPEENCQDGVTVEIGARDDKVSVPAGDFQRVIRVDTVEPVCQDAGIVTESFAPGVGLVRRTENTFAGPLVWDLTYAELGDVTLPRGRYSTALHLSSPRYVNNLMPPVEPDSLPRVRGAFSLRNLTAEPAELVFTGCRSLMLEVRNDKGELVLTTSSNDGGCCDCESLVMVDLAKEAFALGFAFKLADQDGQPLPDGFYTITAILDTVGSEHVRPAARAKIEVASTH